MVMPVVPPPDTPPYPLAPECRYLNAAEAQLAISRLQSQLKSTRFNDAKPSEICGLAKARLDRGTVVYTDATGRYLLLAFALDTHRGSPADNENELETAISERETELPRANVAK